MKRLFLLFILTLFWSTTTVFAQNHERSSQKFEAIKSFVENGNMKITEIPDQYVQFQVFNYRSSSCYAYAEFFIDGVKIGSTNLPPGYSGGGGNMVPVGATMTITVYGNCPGGGADIIQYDVFWIHYKKGPGSVTHDEGRFSNQTGSSYPKVKIYECVM